MTQCQCEGTCLPARPAHRKVALLSDGKPVIRTNNTSTGVYLFRTHNQYLHLSSLPDNCRTIRALSPYINWIRVLKQLRPAWTCAVLVLVKESGTERQIMWEPVPSNAGTKQHEKSWVRDPLAERGFLEWATSPYECSQRHASLHVRVYFTWHVTIIYIYMYTDWTPSTGSRHPTSGRCRKAMLRFWVWSRTRERERERETPFQTLSYLVPNMPYDIWGQNNDSDTH